ncbi:hypothetical protein PRIPAC_73147 [Pristionchus pacificus]|nr:hypothetical protein PRIPAC_73147 [Pristionchus pacificus]
MNDTENEDVIYHEYHEYYVPLLGAVFGIPLFIIGCLILFTARNRSLQQRQAELLHNRRISTHSQSGGVYIGGRRVTIL